MKKILRHISKIKKLTNTYYSMPRSLKRHSSSSIVRTTLTYRYYYYLYLPDQKMNLRQVM